jgi:hypothetical protein
MIRRSFFERCLRIPRTKIQIHKKLYVKNTCQGHVRASPAQTIITTSLPHRTCKPPPIHIYTHISVSLSSCLGLMTTRQKKKIIRAPTAVGKKMGASWRLKARHFNGSQIQWQTFHTYNSTRILKTAQGHWRLTGTFVYSIRIYIFFFISFCCWGYGLGISNSCAFFSVSDIEWAAR